MRCIVFFIMLSLFGCIEVDKPNKTETLKPNILFILVDDLGKEWISAYGAEDIETPNIDALAKKGIKFHNAYSMPQCTPSRVTLLTGQYPFRHGWVNHWDVPRWGGGAHFDEKLNPSLVKKLRDQGYRTCVAGKWQIDDFRVEPDALVKVGFDDFCMWTGYEAGIKASAERYWNPYVFTKDGSKTYKDAFGPDVFRDFIIDFLKEDTVKPSFVYYPMVLTHTPFVNTPDETADDKIGKHKAMVRYTDKILGQLIQSLKENNIFQNTLIVFTTDNGTTKTITGGYKGRKVRGGKATTAEAGICQPFIVSWPKNIKGGQESNALVDFTDLLPTFIDVAGGAPDVDGKHVIDGKSFKSVLLEGRDTSREWILGMGGGNFARLTENGVENQYKFRDRVLRNREYKLYLDSKGEVMKFYDLEADPFEENNIIEELNTKARITNFNMLKSVAESFPDKDNDPKYNPNPGQDWDVNITAKSDFWKL
ncbi:sulfatase-like hydrolase/transferase [Cytophaga sp. FL35]|uniref:sulfatase-like hydrolase/transferase n=1 Tax=Cytophaga sp. FL35 TaxID=1904456 RepID=UPI001653AB3A|nr:sulfatase-like hydrolase/transferase [Cytophaga sp. FL35]MBC6998484.1 sulfatase-like hydrolase/transferase [Cytophaga sp. FL35]